MASRLHHFGDILFDLQHDVSMLQSKGINDNNKIDSLKNFAYCSFIVNFCILMVMCIYQYTCITN